MKRIGLGLFGCLLAGHVMADPDCSGPERWPAGSAFVHLKNAGLTDNGKVDSGKTKVVCLASERIGSDLYQQIHLVSFTEKTGKVISVITNSQASSAECSMSAVDVFVISQRLGGR